MIFNNESEGRKVRSFTISASFMENYAGSQPKWGPLGYVTYKRTYARPMPDGASEEFWQTCQRVVEGVYNIQKIHCRRLGLPWDDRKAQKSAQEMYRRMWEFKFTPPGRGLWMMGTDQVYKNGSAALNNCFAPETKVLANVDGVIKVASLQDLTDVDNLKTLSRDGEWRASKVNNFGRQALKKVTFKPAGLRSNFALEYEATADHRWILSNGEVTTSLKVGDKVTIKPSARACADGPEYADGFAHGFVFGDGSAHTVYSTRFQARLCGVKAGLADALKQSAYHFNTTTPESYGGDPMVWFKSEIDLKSLPSDRLGLKYLQGFLAGWIAADASAISDGRFKLASQDSTAIDWLIERAPLLGFCVTGVNTDSVMETNYGRRSAPCIRLSLTDRPVDYVVKAITDEGREDDVLCVTEPETQSFALAGGLVTGNCAFVSTKDIATDFSAPFTFLMDMSMLGVGVGGDCKGAGTVKIVKPATVSVTHVVEDTREGWVNLVKTVLDAYVGKVAMPTEIDYSQVRPFGAPIKGFGGVASGPQPLIDLVGRIKAVLDTPGQYITTSQIVDIFNVIGVCVVAGNVRRTAEIMFGAADDTEFAALKDPSAMNDLYARLSELDEETDAAEIASINAEISNHPLRTHRWASNNSIFAEVGMDYRAIAEKIKANGEPGLVWLDTMREYGRMIDQPDGKDYRAMGSNPCAEQTLESFELCCLVETFPAHHDSLDDYLETLKYAYLYAKTVTLVPTHDERTNRVMNRNRRIGCSQSGIVQAMNKLGRREYLNWCNTGYGKIKELDKTYAEWLGVPRSIKMTSVKPSGTVSLLCGATPGIHYPHSEYYIRRIRISTASPLVAQCREAGYPVEADVYDQSGKTVVVSFSVKEEHYGKSKDDVTIWEQVANAADLQHYWADNQVSVTVTFRKDEADQIPTVLEVFENRLKSISFLPISEHGYAQAPYESIDAETYESLVSQIKPMVLTSDNHEVDDKFCDGETCTI